MGICIVLISYMHGQIILLNLKQKKTLLILISLIQMVADYNFLKTLIMTYILLVLEDLLSKLCLNMIKFSIIKKMIQLGRLQYQVGKMVAMVLIYQKVKIDLGLSF